MWFPRVFGPRQCEQIIATGQQLGRERGQVSLGVRQSSNDAVRRAAIAWMSPGGEHAWIFEKLAQIVARANKVYQYDLLGFTEDAQFTSYDARGDFYDWHQDGLEGQLAIRKLSLVVQLSDPRHYDGSELELFGLSADPHIHRAWRADLKRQGSVTVFPAFEYHRVTGLTRGERHSLVCWVGGPPFR